MVECDFVEFLLGHAIMIGAYLSLIYFLPPYAVAFGLLAFLPRLRWLLPAALTAAVLCVWIGQRIAMQDARFGPGLNVLLLITVGFGFTAGFIARTSLLIAQAYRPHCARPKLILPAAFVATPLILIGLIKIMIALG